MTLIISTSEELEKTLAPEGLHNSVLAAVYDLGLQEGFKGGPPKQKLAVLFELEPRISDGPLGGQRYLVSMLCTASWHKRSNLRKVVRALRPELANAEGGAQIDLESLVASPCMTQVEHVERNGGGDTVARISSVAPHVKGLEVLKPEFDPANVPEWIERFREQRLDREQPGHSQAGSPPPAEASGSDSAEEESASLF